VSGPTRFVLRAVNEDPGQMLRLMRFREQHPEVDIRVGPGFWQAEIPAGNGGTIITTRFVLEELLDKLDELLAAADRPGPARSGS
jgi:hypothetical protein